MARYDSMAHADLTSLRSVQRFRLRRRRAPGPLRTVSARRRNGDVGMVFMVMIAGAIAAGLFVVPYLLRDTPASPPKVAAAGPHADRPAPPAAVVKRLGPAQAESTAAAVQPAPAVAQTSAAVSEDKPAKREHTPFNLATLPVLEDDAAFDPDQMASAIAQPVATRGGQRR